MALLGIKLSVPVPVRPDGWTPSVTDTFSDYQYSTVSKVFNVLKSNTSGANEADVMDSILNTATTGLIAQIETWLGSLEITVADVDYWVLIKGLTNNVD